MEGGGGGGDDEDGNTAEKTQDEATKNLLQSDNSGGNTSTQRTLSEEPTQSNEHKHVGAVNPHAVVISRHDIAEIPSQSHQHANKDILFTTDKSSTHPNTSKTDNPNAQGISVIPSQSRHGMETHQTVSTPARDALKALIKIKIEEKAHHQSSEEAVDERDDRGALVIHEAPSTSDDINLSQEYQEESMEWSHDDDGTRSCDDSTSPGTSPNKNVLKREKHRFAARRYRYKEIWIKDKLQRDEKVLSEANAKLEAREKELEAIKAECMEELKNMDKNVLCKGLSALADVVPPGLEDAVVSVKMVLYREIAGQIKELAHFVNQDQIVPEQGRSIDQNIGIHPQDLVLVPPRASSSSTTDDKLIITCRPVSEESAKSSASNNPVIDTIPGIIYAGEGTIMVASMNPSHETSHDASEKVLPHVNPLNIGNQVTVPHAGNQQNVQTQLHSGRQHEITSQLHAVNYAGSTVQPGTSGATTIELRSQHSVAQPTAVNYSSVHPGASGAPTIELRNQHLVAQQTAVNYPAGSTVHPGTAVHPGTSGVTTIELRNQHPGVQPTAVNYSAGSVVHPGTSGATTIELRNQHPEAHPTAVNYSAGSVVHPGTGGATTIELRNQHQGAQPITIELRNQHPVAQPTAMNYTTGSAVHPGTSGSITIELQNQHPVAQPTPMIYSAVQPGTGTTSRAATIELKKQHRIAQPTAVNFSDGSAVHPGTSGASTIELKSLHPDHPVVQPTATIYTEKQLPITAPVRQQYVSAPKTEYVVAPSKEYVSAHRTEYVVAPGKEYISASRTEHVVALGKEYVSAPRTEHVAAPSKEYVTSPSMNPTPIVTNLHSPKERPMPVLEQSAPIDLSKSTGLKEAKKFDKVEAKPGDIQVQEVSQSSSVNDDMSSAAMALIDLSNAHALIDLSKTGAMRRLDLAPVEKDTSSINTLQSVVPNISSEMTVQPEYSHAQPYTQQTSTYQVDPSKIGTPVRSDPFIMSPPIISTPPKQTDPLDLSKSKSEKQEGDVKETGPQTSRDSSKPVIVFVQSLATGMGELPRIDLNQTKPSLPVTTNHATIQSNIQATQSSQYHSIHEPRPDELAPISPTKVTDTYSPEQPSTSGHSPEHSSPEPCQLGSPVKLLHKSLMSPARAPIQPLIGITRKERQRYASKKNRQKNQLIKKALLQDEDHLKKANAKLSDIIQDLESIKRTCIAQLASTNPLVNHQLRTHSSIKQEAQTKPYWDQKLKVAVSLQVPVVKEAPIFISADIPFTALCSDEEMWCKPIDPKFLNTVLMTVKLGKLEWSGTLLSEGRVHENQEDISDDKMEVADVMQRVKPEERMDTGGGHAEQPSVPLDDTQLQQMRASQVAEALDEHMEIGDASTVPLGVGAQLLLQFKANVEAQKHGQK